MRHRNRLGQLFRRFQILLNSERTVQEQVLWMTKWGRMMMVSSTMGVRRSLVQLFLSMVGPLSHRTMKCGMLNKVRAEDPMTPGEAEASERAFGFLADRTTSTSHWLMMPLRQVTDQRDE